MIDVEPLSQNEWLVTVKGQTTTEHRVRVTPEEVRRLAGEKSSTPQLLACLQGLAARTGVMLEEGAALPVQIKDRRLSLEIAAIVHLARHFVGLLRTRDPLSGNVRLGKMGVAGIGLLGAVKGMFGRMMSAPGAVNGSTVDERRRTN